MSMSYPGTSNTGGGMVAPLLAAAAPAIVQGITGLLGGFLSGGQKNKERKWAQEDRQTRINDANSLMPALARVNIEQGMGPFAEMIQRLLGGSASRYLGDSAKASGLDFTNIFGAMPSFIGGQQPMPRSLPPMPPGMQPGMGGPGGPMGRRPLGDYAGSIMGKYGMERG
jgi:hypothetical protein